jgi:hypothetical protein
VTGRHVIAAAVAVLLGLGVALTAYRAGRAVQAEPDLGTVAALVYPGRAVATDRDASGAGWVAFMMAADEPAEPQIAPRDQRTTPDAAAVRARVEAAGWHTSDGRPDSLAFSAARDGVRFDFYAFDGDTFTVVGKRATASTVAVAVAAGVAAAVLGWWLCLSGTRRLRTVSPGARTAVRETTVVGLVLTGPALVQTALLLSGRTTADFGPPPWADLLVQYARWPAALGLVLLLAAATGALTAAPVDPQPSG